LPALLGPPPASVWVHVRGCAFVFADTAPAQVRPLPLHDALPISRAGREAAAGGRQQAGPGGSPPQPGTVPGGSRSFGLPGVPDLDRKSTRLNSSHVKISYAVFCLKKKRESTTSSTTCSGHPFRRT